MGTTKPMLSAWRARLVCWSQNAIAVRTWAANVHNDNAEILVHGRLEDAKHCRFASISHPALAD
jgi:hypothetical protein